MNMTTYEPKKETILARTVALGKQYPGILFETVEKDHLLGIPYVLGGNGVTGTDCGKFAHDLLGILGFPIESRDCEDIYEQFKEEHLIVEKFEAVRTGDLLFFKNTYGDFDEDTITHVGFYVNKDTLLHASSSAGTAYTQDMQYYWIDHFAAVGKLNLIK
jgi:cell wall-associated NlpC family hydrolase